MKNQVLFKEELFNWIERDTRRQYETYVMVLIRYLLYYNLISQDLLKANVVQYVRYYDIEYFIDEVLLDEDRDITSFLS